MDTQDGIVAKDTGLTVLESIQSGAGSTAGQGMTLASARAELDGPQSGSRRQTGGGWMRRRSIPALTGAWSRNFPRSAGVGRSGLAPRLPQADGRLHGAGRPGRLHQAARRADLPLRQGAGRSGPRQADVLRHRASRSPPARFRCWSRATSSGRSRSTAIPSTR